MTKDRKLKQSTLKLTGLLQVRRGCGRVVWLRRLARIMKSLVSERREKCGRRHDGIGCGVDEPVFTCKVSKSRQLRVVSFSCKT